MDPACVPPVTNTCKNCQHWTADGVQTYQYYEPVTETEGNHAVAPHRVCSAVKLVRSPDAPGPVLAFTQDASGYMADLWTAAEFSCALFEQTTPTDQGRDSHD